MATIGRRRGVANVLGINFSGPIAWWFWRTVYLIKLPRVEKKLRVALEWTLDLFFTKDMVRHHRLLHDAVSASMVSEAGDYQASRITPSDASNSW